MKLLPMIAALLLAGSAAGAEESPTPRLRGFTMPDAPQHLKAAKEAGGNAVRLMTRPKVKSAPDGGYTLDISHIETFLDAARKPESRSSSICTMCRTRTGRITARTGSARRPISGRTTAISNS